MMLTSPQDDEYGPFDQSPYVPDNTLPYGFDPIAMQEGVSINNLLVASQGQPLVRCCSPTPSNVDISSLLIPRVAPLPSGMGARVVRSLFTPCPHCKLSEAPYCLFHKHRDELEFWEHTVKILAQERGAVSMRECRHNLYYQMVDVCLPLREGVERRIPHCLVREIQSLFPDVGKAHLISEHSVHVRKRKGKVLIQVRSRPIPF